MTIYLSASLNSSKTEGMWIGSLKRKDEKPFGIKWPSEPIKALGTFFTYDQSLLYEKNFQEKVDSISPTHLVEIFGSKCNF